MIDLIKILKFHGVISSMIFIKTSIYAISLLLQFSKKFLVDVWNTFDHLKGEDFQPKTFFLLHGKYWCLYMLAINRCMSEKCIGDFKNFLVENPHFFNFWIKVMATYDQKFGMKMTAREKCGFSTKKFLKSLLPL